MANPESSYEAGFCDTPDGVYGVAVAGNYAYLAAWGSGLLVINVANPESSFETGSCSVLDYYEGVAVAGNFAYLAGYSGLRIINVANPQSPYEAGFYDTPSEADGVAISGNYAYVADNGAGLQIIEFPGAGVEEEHSTPYALRTTPVPTIVRGALELPLGRPGQSTTGQSLVFLLDATGRRVAALHPGRNDVSLLGAGVYFVRGLGSGTGGQGETRKVVIAR